MAGTGDKIKMREYAERARRMFTTTDRRELLPDPAPRRKGMIVTLCVLLACLLWFTFSMRETYTQFFDFPTEIQNLPADQALLELPPETVRVQVEGEGVQLLRLYYNPPTVSLDVSEDQIDLQVKTAEVAGNVRHESVVPASIVVRKEPRVERRIPIRSAARLRMESGYEIVGPIQLSPDSVTVSGAASILDALEYWPTEASIVDMVTDTIRVQMSLSDTLAGLVRVDATTVQMRADVLRFTSGRRMIDVRVKDAPLNDAVIFDPSRTTVTYNVPISQYDEADSAEDLYAFVPYEEIVSDTTGNVYPIVNVPERLLLREVRIFPDAFRYYHNLPGLD